MNSNLWWLTDSRLRTGEVAVLRHQVCIVAFTRQNLHHLAHFLGAALFGPSVHPEPNICSVTGKLPSAQRQAPKLILLSLYYVFKSAAGVINKCCWLPCTSGGCWVPQRHTPAGRRSRGWWSRCCRTGPSPSPERSTTWAPCRRI